MQGLVVTASLSTPITDRGSIVFLPEGVHTVHATIGGKPGVADVWVDKDVLAAFSEDLKERLSRNVRPFAGFDHIPGPASFLPVEFRYEEGVGLILDVEWTQAGRTAVEGMNYSYFSPTFRLGKDGRPMGLLPNGEIGSLTNDPAFEQISRIAASRTDTIMDIQHLIDLGLVEANHDPETAIEAAKANLNTLRTSAAELVTVQAAKQVMDGEKDAMCQEIEALRAENKAMKDELDGYKAAKKTECERIADEAVAEAVKAGRIPAQNDEVKAYWRESIIADVRAKSALEAIPANPALSGQIINANRTDEKPELKGIEALTAIFAAESK
jgi:phage I-like protein